jgi:hypothetical protein
VARLGGGGIAIIVGVRLGGTEGGMETLRETVLFVGSVRGLDLFLGFPEGEGESRGDLVVLSVVIVAVVVLGIVVFDC